MKIFIKLLEIKILGNSFFGFSNNWATIFLLPDLDSAASFNVVLDKEKKATSAPEIKGGNSSNKNNITTLSINQMFVFCIKNKNVGSGSKL